MRLSAEFLSAELLHYGIFWAISNIQPLVLMLNWCLLKDCRLRCHLTVFLCCGEVQKLLIVVSGEFKFFLKNYYFFCSTRICSKIVNC